LAVGACLVIVLYSALTVARIGVWTSGVSLWSDVVRHQFHLGGSGPVVARDLGGVDVRGLVDPGPLVSLRRAYDSNGRKAEAQGFDSLLARVERQGDEHSEMKLAREDLAAGRYEDALRRLRPVAAGKSWFAPLAMFRISVAQEKMGQAEPSRESMRRALLLYQEHNQSPTDAYFEAGVNEYLNRNFAKAIEWYRFALRASPREANVALHLGLALEETGQIPQAMELYKGIVKGDLLFSPSSRVTVTDVLLQMGVAAKKLGHTQEAVGYLEEALRRSPNHPKRTAVLAEIAALRANAAP
jgi:tetratricopeptide (TPR) repeat protein